MLTGAAAAALAAPAVAVAAAPVVPDQDAELVALGEQFENLFRKYAEASLQWGPLSCAAHAELEKKHGTGWAGMPEKQMRAAVRSLARIMKRNGCEAAGDRLHALFQAMESLAEAIKDSPISSVGGLRAKALVVLWEVWPPTGDHEGKFVFPDDGGATQSLVYAAAELTGLAPMVNEIEARLAANATESDDGEALS